MRPLNLCTLAILAGLAACAEPRGYPPIDPGDPAQVARGAELYAAQCASCHGAQLEGQPDWRTPLPNGRLPAPPHDKSGHTWHHPDAVLFELTKHGMKPPHAPEGYESDMPGFAKTMSDEEIAATLAYIKSRWPDDIRARQSGLAKR